MSPEMIETARLLMAHPKCPEGLLMYTVSEPEAIDWCDCGAACVGSRCTECRANWGDPLDDPLDEGDRVPDLSDSPAGLANVGPLMVALCGWEVATPTCSGGAWSALHVLAGRACMAHTPAHLAALALLAVPQ